MGVVAHVQAQSVAGFCPQSLVVAQVKFNIRHDLWCLEVGVKRNFPLAADFLAFTDEELLLSQLQVAVLNKSIHHWVAWLIQPSVHDFPNVQVSGR